MSSRRPSHDRATSSKSSKSKRRRAEAPEVSDGIETLDTKSGGSTCSFSVPQVLETAPVVPGPPKECSICLDVIEPTSALGFLENCSHIFHPTCLTEWITTSESTRKCPNCRSRSNVVVIWPTLFPDEETKKTIFGLYGKQFAAPSELIVRMDLNTNPNRLYDEAILAIQGRDITRPVTLLPSVALTVDRTSPANYHRAIDHMAFHVAQVILDGRYYEPQATAAVDPLPEDNEEVDTSVSSDTDTDDPPPTSSIHLRSRTINRNPQ